MKRFLLLGFLVNLACFPVQSADWKEILGPSQGVVPDPVAGEVVWRDDLMAAFVEAQEANRPLLVTWRCIPCKQCAEFDKSVLEGGSALSPLLNQFVTVRLTDAAQLDDRIFRYREFQDLDLSWWGYFLSPEREIYGVFGGKDHVSDATRISEAAFVNSLNRVLKHHYDPRRSSWKIDGPGAETQGGLSGPKETGAFAGYAATRPWMSQQECVHCHQVGDLVHFENMENGTFDVRQLIQRWPLPENVGLIVDRDDGLLITEVAAGSAAESAGLKAGDRLGMAGGRKLYGQADFRGVLHRASYGPAEIPVAVRRDEEVIETTLETEDNWRAAENSWRKTVYDGIYGPRLGFFPIKGPRQGKGTLSIKPFMGPGKKAQENPWWSTGLRPNMEIVEVNGVSDDWNSRQFLTWFRVNHEVGDTVKVRVKGGQEFSQVLEK